MGFLSQSFAKINFADTDQQSKRVILATAKRWNSESFLFSAL
jgi:hypothetical protein